MKKKKREILLPNEYKENDSLNYLSDTVKKYEIKRSVPEQKFGNIKPHKIERARIYGDFLGTVKDVIATLETLCQAYYIFLLLDIAINNLESAKKILCLDVSDLSEYSYVLKKYGGYKYILPNEDLVISKINFNSPGFWEVIGALNPLTQIREYINDRHNRKRDKQFWKSELYKSALENQKLELENQKLALQNQEYSIELSLKKIALTKEIYSVLQNSGCSEAELRKFTNECVGTLAKLEHCIDDNRITRVEIEE